jgi:hypothetical protein
MSKAKSDDTSKAGVSSQVTAVDQREFVRDKALIESRIKMTYPDANGFTYEPNVSNAIIGNGYFIEFTSEELDDHESYYFCLVDNSKVEAFDSEQELLYHALNLMDRRRTAWQKLEGFTVADVLALLVAMVLSAVLLMEAPDIKNGGSYSKEIIALFGIIVGYLFGRKA